jgi:hypothetical protein
LALGPVDLLATLRQRSPGPALQPAPVDFRAID